MVAKYYVNVIVGRLIETRVVFEYGFEEIIIMFDMEINRNKSCI